MSEYITSTAPCVQDEGELPLFHVEARSIPEALYEALRVVHFGGHTLRTQYDRRRSDGTFLDPPGKDARVTIRIREPFAQPRFPALSYCERGKYIAEFLGAKDHLVVPYKELVGMIGAGEEFEATQWPYCYHQRLTAYPRSDGTTIDQLELMLEKLAREPITRRAAATTRVPEIDLFMAADMPCLGEVQLRAIEGPEGRLVLNMYTVWRSRDLYKAWADNLIGITNLQARLAARLSARTGREVRVGPYCETSASLHIYGQDYLSKGMDTFFTRFPDCDSFIRRARTSAQVCETEVIPQLEELLEEATWRFPAAARDLIRGLIEDFRSGRYLP